MIDEIDKCQQRAKQCIKLMNRRYFDGNIIDCHYWDGSTDYHIQESVKEQSERLKRFQQQIINS